LKTNIFTSNKHSSLLGTYNDGVEVVNLEVVNLEVVNLEVVGLSPEFVRCQPWGQAVLLKVYLHKQ
jgi:hypothetical protein